MARGTRGTPPPTAPDNDEEMTVIVVRVKGRGTTLQKGLDAISNAFAALGPSQAPSQSNHRVINAQQRELPTSQEEEFADNEDADETPEKAAPRSSPSSTKRGPRKYKFQEDLDLNQGDTPWKEFATSKALKNDHERYLLASLWLTESGNLPEFGIKHVFTLFRATGWNEQADFSQPMRVMKSKRSYFSQPAKNLWKLTGPGLDAARAIGTGENK